MGELGAGSELIDSDPNGRRIAIITDDNSLGLVTGVQQALVIDREALSGGRIASAFSTGLVADDIVIGGAISPSSNLLAFTSAATNLGPFELNALQGSLFVSVQNTPPRGSVTILGDAIRGQVLQVSQTISDSDGIPGAGAGALSYEWLADAQSIAGASGQSLALGANLVGKSIQARVSYIDNSGNPETVISAPTARVTGGAVAERNGRLKYFIVTNDRPNFFDLSLDVPAGPKSPELSLRTEVIELYGSDKVDAVFVRPGAVLDFSFSGASADKVYLSGPFSSYLASVAGTTLTLKRGTGYDLEQVTVNVVNSESASDQLVFSDGTLSAISIATKIGMPSAPSLVPSGSETSLAPVAPAAPGSELGAKVKAFSLNLNGDTFAPIKPGMQLIAFGSRSVDRLFVASGSAVDATGLGASRDQIFFSAKWEDYQKILPTDPSGNTMVLQRQVGQHVERVEVSAQAGASDDSLIFSNGAISSVEAFKALRQSPGIGLAGIPGYDAELFTPLGS
jgi:hypothetical protein